MNDINVKQYFKLKLDKRFPYDALLNTVKPKDILGFKIDLLSWDDVKGINKRLQKANSLDEVFEVFQLAFKISKESFLNIDIVKYFQIKKFLIDKFVYLHKNEGLLLQSDSVDVGLWELAGGRKLDYFSDNLPLSQLAKIYGGYPFDYGKRPYNEIVYLLKMNKEQSEVDNKYQELKTKQK